MKIFKKEKLYYVIFFTFIFLLSANSIILKARSLNDLINERALEKFINAKNLVYSEEEAKDTKFLFNCETKTTVNNFENMINLIKNNEKSIDGAVFGRVDYVGSLGLNRTNIESEVVTNDVIYISKLCKQIDLEFVVGGAVSYDAKNNLNTFKSSHLSRFETRKIIFNSEALTMNSLQTLGNLLDWV